MNKKYLARLVALTNEAEQKLRELGVTAIYLFGSRAEGTARPGSDYDFAIIMNDAQQVSPNIPMDLYGALLDILNTAIIKRDFKTIDLVFLQRVPLYYSMNAFKYGKLIYDGDPQARLRFEERVRLMYMDFEPYRKALEEATLALV